MSTQDLQVQLEQLHELLRFLDQFKETMDQCIAEYRQRIQQMQENGLTVQVANRFEVEHIGAVNYFIQQAKSHIDEKSIPFTRQNIQLTEDLIRLNQD